MSIVIDSSVVVAALIDNGSGGAWAEHTIGGETLYAPDLLRAELTNILRRLESAQQITTPEATAALDDLMELEIELFPFDPFSDGVWELRHTVTSYDAYYVAVAEALSFPLITLDERLARAAGPKCNFLTPGAR